MHAYNVFLFSFLFLSLFVYLECEGLGFPNATLNKCGYCTQGNTGLAANYSMDCFGSCSVPGLVGPVVDCAGVCGGSAYIDECSGQCIG